MKINLSEMSKIKGKQISSQTVTINGDTGNVVVQGDLLMYNNRILTSRVIFNDNELVTKSYVDSVAAGLDPKESVRVATTTGENINLSNVLTIDGYTLLDKDRVLIKNQLDASKNGIYSYNILTNSLVRSSDSDGTPSKEISLGNYTFVEKGDTLSGTGWVLGSTDSPISTIIPDVNTQIWVQYSGIGTYLTDGEGIQLSNNTFSLVLNGTTLSKSTSGLKISDTFVSSISTQISSVISTESSSRVSGDGSLSTILSSESSTRLSGDGSLSTSISNISNNLSSESSSRISGDGSLSTVISTRLSSETSSRISGDGSLSTSISNISNNLSSETSSRISGDGSLSSIVSSESSTRLSGDGSLSTSISNISNNLLSETSTRISGDGSLSTGLSTEISLRISGDGSLSTRLSSESSTRLSGDGSLSTSISNISNNLSSETSTRISGDGSLSTGLSTEISLRISGDGSLSTLISNELSTEISTRISFDSSLSTVISSISAPIFIKSSFLPSNAGSTDSILVSSTAFPILDTTETVQDASVVIFLNGLYYSFDYSKGTSVFHTNGIIPNSTSSTPLYFNGVSAGFSIELDDDVQIKYIKTV